jgi:hippurate hydrolase
LQTISSREVNPLEPVVVTVGSIHGGTKHNIIPDEVQMQLTVRTYNEEVREQTLKAIERIVKKTAQAAGAEVPEPTVTVTDQGSPVLYNDPALVERITGVFRAALGEENVVRREPVMAGEDFGRYGRTEEKVPIFLFWLGAVEPGKVEASKNEAATALPGLHSPQFLPDREATIKTGVVTMTAAAIDMLKQ